ncbi:MAG: carboxypeptidase regulatory-like domain-containing protein, partial [Deltaproteobacteria bacterium]|nr:carboxypeptidase regulatory-like domain-containing protein [Deltaproteobacteria bacterium]
TGTTATTTTGTTTTGTTTTGTSTTGTTGCANPCTPGSVACNGNTVQTCQQQGSCYAFVDSTPCTGSQVCQGGTCVDPTCNGGCATPPGASCQDANTRITYAASGTCNNGSCSYAPALQACAYGCAQGVCLPQPTCTPNAVRCNGTQVETCNANGTAWLYTSNCPSTCNNGLCDAPCTPGATRCDGATVDTCNNPGTAWVPAASGACANGCIAGGCIEDSLDVQGNTIYMQGEHHFSGIVKVELGGQIVAGPGPDGGAATGQLTIYAPEIDIENSSSISGSTHVASCAADPDDVANGIRLIADTVIINGTLSWSGSGCNLDGIVVRADTINGSGTVSAPNGRSLLLYGTGGVATGLGATGAVKSLMPPASITSANFPAGGLYNDDAPPPLFSWDRPYSTVAGYYYSFDFNASEVPTQTSTYLGTEALALTQPPQVGTSFLNVVSADTNGNVGTIPHRFQIQVQSTTPVLSSPTNPNQGTYSSNPAVTVAWQAGSGNPGVGYYYVFDHFPDTRPTVATGTFVSPTHAPQIFMPTVAAGRWWFHMLGLDSMGYPTKRAAHYEVDIGTAPATGTLAGTVTDGTNPIAGVQVVVQRGLYVATTDTNGIYDFNNNVPAGTYEVVANKSGYQSVQATVTVIAGQSVTHPFTMSLGSGCPTCTDLCSGVACGSALINGVPTNATCNAGACINGGLLGENFENGCPGWTLTGSALGGSLWQCGTPSSGPGSAHAGTGVLATNLSGNYPDNVGWGTNTATTPMIDLTGTSAPKFHAWMWIYTEGSAYDGVNLKVSTDGVNFSEITNVSYVSAANGTTTTGYPLTIANQTAWGGNLSNAGWQEYTADLSAFAGQHVYVEFDFHSDGSDNFPGVYVDDVSVTDP